MSATDEMNERPHKRTGVWSNDPVKQKTSDTVLKRFGKSDVKRISSVEDDDDIPIQRDKDLIACRSPVISSPRRNIKVDLCKVPALNSLMSETNINVLLNQFNYPDEVKENDVPWSEDLLFAEITNKLSKDRLRPTNSNT